MTPRTLLPVLFVLAGCGGPATRQETTTVTIPAGATLHAAAESLAAHQVIASARLFRFYAHLTGRHRAIQAGTFVLRIHTSIHETLDALSGGPPATKALTVPEGLTLRETANAISRQLGIPPDSVVAAAGDSALRAQLHVPTPTLEGYLFPSTYSVRVGATAREVVWMMADEFQRRWRPQWTARLDSLALSRHELVTLASIIEEEVRYAPDRPYVASVYYNRLHRGMPLQADPTVAYALGERRRLYERDYDVQSPYNTYLIQGLPPGPIGSPSTASILAALYPAQTDFLYFVARPDGKHVFSRTYREHLRAIREIRR